MYVSTISVLKLVIKLSGVTCAMIMVTRTHFTA